MSHDWDNPAGTDRPPAYPPAAHPPVSSQPAPYGQPYPPPQQPYGQPQYGPPTYGPPPARSPKRRKGLLITALVVVALGIAATATAVIYRSIPGTDSGVQACKDIAASANKPDSTNGGTPSAPFTVTDYQRARAQFADSRYDDIRVAGVAMMDLAWQMSKSTPGANGDADFGMLAFLGPIINDYAALAGACANHGVILPKLADG